MYKGIIWYVLFLPRNIFHKWKIKQISEFTKTVWFVLKTFQRKVFHFGGNVKIINPTLRFLMKVLTQKIKINLYKNQIYKANLNSFSNQCSDSVSKLSSSKSPLPFCHILYTSNIFLQLGTLALRRHLEDTQAL